MDNNVKPSTIMLIAGGAVLLLSSFLDWVTFGPFGINGWETAGFGLHGIFVAIIGVVIAVGVALRQFSSVSMPDRIIGFDSNQIHLILGFAAFLIMFGNQFRSDAAIGILLGWIAAAVIVVGAYLDIRDSGSDAAPTQF